jgi:hypothetical protein
MTNSPSPIGRLANLNARPLLEKSVRDIGRDQEHRLRAIAALRDLLLSQGDLERAGSVQRELVECQTQRWVAIILTRSRAGPILPRS